MIYTVTLNPAIDCAVSAERILYGKVNRADSETIRFGGKGINVSYVLKEFGADSILTGFAAGFTGDALVAGLTADRFSCDFVKLSQGVTRINVKLTSSAAEGDPDTEINAPGPTPSRDELDLLTDKLSALVPGDAVVLAGSLPAGASSDYITVLVDAIPDGVALICDLSGDALRICLNAEPDLVKPNIHELSELLGCPVTAKNLEDGAERVISMGAKNALITMGENGAYYVTAEGDSGFVPSPPAPDTDRVKSAVGCGDSAVAGWLIGMGYAGEDVRRLALALAGIDDSLGRAETAARLGVAFGSASYYFGFPVSREKIKTLRGT